MKKTKMLRIVAAALMFAISATALFACSGQSAEEAIKSDLASQFEPVKNLDQEALDKLVADVGTAGFDTLGIDSEAYVRSVMEGFDYNIDNVSVEGETAIATVTLTCKSFADAQVRAQELAEEFAASDEVLGMTDTDAINAKIGEITMQAIDETQPKSTACEFSYTKNGNAWTIDGSAQSELYRAFFA